MDKPTFKKELILALSGITKIDTSAFDSSKLPAGVSLDFCESELIIFTSGSMITGTIKKAGNDATAKTGENASSFPLLSWATRVIAERYRKNHAIVGAMEGNDGCLVLENAVITYADKFTVSLQEVAVFYDQIVAVSVVKRD